MGRRGPQQGHALVFGALCAGLPVLPVLLNYEATVRLLKWLTLALLAYVAVVFVLHVDWGLVLARTIVPQLQSNGANRQMIVAVLGTTVSLYLFFWLAALAMGAAVAGMLATF
jgi:Mn2+/Fe2+ NRAMP family transporter